MKKRDFFLIAAVLLAAGVCWLLPRGMGLFAKQGETMLKITVNGDLYGTYSMSKDRIIEIKDTNICEIKDGKVNMIQAECPDHLCMHQGPAKTQGETIVCLPNKVVLEISAKDGSTDENQIDSLVQ